MEEQIKNTAAKPNDEQKKPKPTFIQKIKSYFNIKKLNKKLKGWGDSPRHLTKRNTEVYWGRLSKRERFQVLAEYLNNMSVYEKNIMIMMSTVALGINELCKKQGIDLEKITSEDKNVDNLVRKNKKD